MIQAARVERGSKFKECLTRHRTDLHFTSFSVDALLSPMSAYKGFRCASATASGSAVRDYVFLVASTSFFPVLFLHKVMFVVNSESDFYLRFDELC